MLETHHLERSWLKAVADQNIAFILVTLDTFHEPMS